MTDIEPSPIASLLDPRSESSLVKLLPTNVLKAISGLDPEDLLKTEQDMKDEMLQLAFPCRIRTSFWDEYVRANKMNEKMVMTNVYSQICTKDQFHHHIIKNKRNLLWVITPPTDFMIQQREHLELGSQVIRKILAQAMSAPTIDMEMARVVLKAFELTRNIVLGPLVQRVDTRTLSVSANAKDIGGLPPEELEKKWKEVQAIEASKVEIDDKIS